jgi:glycosyltransferase involved in cell wall biosynthesis
MVRSERGRCVKVLHVIPTFYPAHYYGGPVQSTFHLCRKLADLGCAVKVLTTNANGPTSVLDVPTDREVEVAPGVRVLYTRRVWADYSLAMLAKIPGMVRWADVVHLTSVYSAPVIPTMLAARLLGKPMVWSPRGSLQRWSGSTRVRLKDGWDAVCRMVQPRNTVMHVTAEEEASESLLRYPKIQAAIIPNGVDVPATLDRKSGNGTLRLVFLGRLHPKKGIENLLDAVATLRGLEWSLAIAGKGDHDYTESIGRRIADLGLTGRASMVGEVVGEEKKRLLENSDLAVFPSFTENFGLVIAEALAHGVPVIASKATPWAKLENRGCGLWVDNDAATVAEAIRRMTRMPMAEMGERGREWMIAEYSWERAAASTAAVYARLTGAPTPAVATLDAQGAI